MTESSTRKGLPRLHTSDVFGLTIPPQSRGIRAKPLRRILETAGLPGTARPELREPWSDLHLTRSVATE